MEGFGITTLCLTFLTLSPSPRRVDVHLKRVEGDFVTPQAALPVTRL